MSITPVPSQTTRVHVYELINRTRLESLLVVTGLESTALVPLLRRDTPPEAGFWQLADDVNVEILGQHMRKESAEEFLKQYLEHMQRRTWRFRVWRP